MLKLILVLLLGAAAGVALFSIGVVPDDWIPPALSERNDAGQVEATPTPTPARSAPATKTPAPTPTADAAPAPSVGATPSAAPAVVPTPRRDSNPYAFARAPLAPQRGAFRDSHSGSAYSNSDAAGSDAYARALPNAQSRRSADHADAPGGP